MNKTIIITSLIFLSTGAFSDFSGYFSQKIHSNFVVNDDLDKDGIKNNLDDDIDGDGVNNDTDSTPFGKIGENNIFNPPSNLDGSINLSCGSNHCYSIKDGTVWSVGLNDYNQLGRASLGFSSSWEPTTLTGVTSVAAGGSHGYALKDGTVWSVGKSGFLGRTGSGDEWLPTDLTDVDFIYGGGLSGYAIKDGELFSTGRGSVPKTTSWVSTDLTGVTKVSGGWAMALALKDGTVWSWGSNQFGQLGRDGDANEWLPTNLTGVTDISAKNDFSYAIKDGTVWSVGNNSQGQLAREGLTTEWLPTDLHGVSDISVGYYTGYAIKDNSVWSVGGYGYGQLAVELPSGIYNTSTWQNTGLTGAESIVSSNYSLYAKKNATLYSVGGNQYGVLARSGVLSHSTFGEISSFSFPLFNINNYNNVCKFDKFSYVYYSADTGKYSGFHKSDSNYTTSALFLNRVFNEDFSFTWNRHRYKYSADINTKTSDDNGDFYYAICRESK